MKRVGPRMISALLSVPSVLIVMLCCALPVAWVLITLLTNPATLHELFPDRFRMLLLGRTLGYNMLAAVVATAMGLPAAFALGRGRGFFVNILWVILPTALLLPSLSYDYGWKQLVHMLQQTLHNLNTRFHPPIDITFAAQTPLDVLRCIGSLAAWLWGVPALIIGLALRQMDISVQQQAQLDGVLRRCTLRHLAGPILASVAIVTLLATQEFSIYEPTGISVMATEIRMVFETGSLSSVANAITAPMAGGAGLQSTDQPARAAAAVATMLPMLLVSGLLAATASWGASRMASEETVAAGSWPRSLDASRWTIFVTTLLVLLNVGVPTAALLKTMRTFVTPIKLWIEYQPQIGGALVTAVATALVAGVLSVSVGIKRVRGMLPLGIASFLIGGQLLAIALIRNYNRPGLFWVYDSIVTTIAAYIGRFGWLAIAAALGTWTHPWRELREMAALDGANSAQTFWNVIWPLGWPTLLAGGLLVGALSLTEVPATVLLMPTRPQVFTPIMMTWVHMENYSKMVEASLLMMGTVIVPALAAVMLLRLGRRSGSILKHKPK